MSAKKSQANWGCATIQRVGTAAPGSPVERSSTVAPQRRVGNRSETMGFSPWEGEQTKKWPHFWGQVQEATNW